MPAVDRRRKSLARASDRVTMPAASPNVVSLATATVSSWSVTRMTAATGSKTLGDAVIVLAPDAVMSRRIGRAPGSLPEVGVATAGATPNLCHKLRPEDQAALRRPECSAAEPWQRASQPPRKIRSGRGGNR